MGRSDFSVAFPDVVLIPYGFGIVTSDYSVYGLVLFSSNPFPARGACMTECPTFIGDLGRSPFCMLSHGSLFEVCI